MSILKKQPWYITPQISYADKRAIIIGGGLAGTSAAYSLARRGWEVTLIERSNALSRGASGNPVGIISPMLAQKTDPIGQFYWQAFKHSLQHLEAIGQNLLNQCGILDLSKVDNDLSFSIIPESEIQKLSREDASALCGVALSGGALHVEKAGLADPADICQKNILACGDKIKIIFERGAISLIKSENGWAALDKAGQEIASAPVCVIANAADSNAFAQSNYIPLQAVRGQLTYLPATLNLQKILCYEGGYISPESSGFHCVGATYSRDNLSLKINAEDNLKNLNNLQKVINISLPTHPSPLPQGEGISGRASLRASVPDRRPVIGAMPNVAAFYDDYADLKHGRSKEYPSGKYLEGLYISTGHGSRGLVSCPIAGEIIARMINEEDKIVPENIMNILSPARFVIKKLQGKL